MDGELTGRVAVVTGATGAIGSAIARRLAAAGAVVGVLARSVDRVEALAAELGGVALPADVRDLAALEAARDRLLERHGRIDVLVNGAGGNVAAATTGERSFFELPVEALEEVVGLNLLGTVLPSRVFGERLAHDPDPPAGGRAIVNVSSTAAHRALTRVVGYGAAKAAVENLTRWLAVELAQTPGRVRVNAVAPGFLVGDQNRALLYDLDGGLTERGARIVAATPAGRFGEPQEVAEAVCWLAGDGAAFVTGAVLPVDGGFGAFSGV